MKPIFIYQIVKTVQAIFKKKNFMLFCHCVYLNTNPTSLLLIPGKAPITKWTETETTALLNAYNSLKQSKSHSHCDLWRRIEHRVRKLGFNRTTDQLTAKISNMRRGYTEAKKARRLNKRTSDPFRVLIHRTFGGAFVENSSGDEYDN
jgi:hypothetical protein